jgi:hypothetical protein
MKARELAEELLKNPEFDVAFTFDDLKHVPADGWPDYRHFENVTIGDIGYSDKVICLDGVERD